MDKGHHAQRPPEARVCRVCGQGGAVTAFSFTQEGQLKRARFHLDCFDLFRSSRR